MNLSGKKTYIVAIAAAIYQALYGMGKIPVDEQTHAMILGLFASAGVVTLRQGIAKTEPPKTPDGSETKPAP